MTGIRLKFALLASIAVVAGCGSSDAQSLPEPVEGAPNIIVITLDDATAEQVTPQSMPSAFREIADEGTRFDDFIVPNPICCPARAAYLTGQYGHNNRVLRNDYRRLKRKGSILPRWLQLAGYRTAHVGKYLNNFQASLERPTEVPWGWDEWFTLLDNSYYDYDVSDNGKRVGFGSDPEDYVTRRLNDRAVELVDGLARGDRPFYLQLDHYAPHPWRASDECGGGATVDPKDVDLIDQIEFPRKRARNERDVGDKPFAIRRADRMTRPQLTSARTHYRCAVASLRSVDRGIERLFSTLRRRGALEETAIFLTSDNGFFYGEHRIPARKEWPYEENLRMPLLVRVPGPLTASPRVARTDAPAANIDLAPTVLELAGGRPCADDRCRTLDGRSLLPLVRSHDADWPHDRAFIVELDQQPSGSQDRPRACSYLGIRQRQRILVLHRTSAPPGRKCRNSDDVELYDMTKDPDQLDNLAGTRRGLSLERRLRAELKRLEGCEGNRANPDSGPDPCD